MNYLNDVSYKDCVGKVCKSKSSGDFKILKYNDYGNVEIQFLKEVEVTTCDICGKDVGDYRWWISMEIDDGCMGEFY